MAVQKLTDRTLLKENVAYLLIVHQKQLTRLKPRVDKCFTNKPGVNLMSLRSVRVRFHKLFTVIQYRN